MGVDVDKPDKKTKNEGEATTLENVTAPFIEETTTLKNTDEDDEDTSLKTEAPPPAKPASTNFNPDELDASKGNSFWELFWAVIYVLANPKTTWEFLPDRVKRPITAVAKMVYNTADKLVITPTQFLVNNAVVKPVDFVVNKLVIDPVAFAVDKLVVTPVNLLVNKVVAAPVKFVADKIEEKVVNPITEKVDAVAEKVVDAITEKLENLSESLSKLRKNSEPEPGDRTFQPSHNRMEHEQGRTPPVSEPPEVKPESNKPGQRSRL